RRRPLARPLDRLGEARRGREGLTVRDDHELEARRPADDAADAIERALVGARDLDDDVGLAPAHAGLAHAEGVDAVVDGVDGLAHGALAPLLDDLLPELDVHDPAVR